MRGVLNPKRSSADAPRYCSVDVLLAVAIRKPPGESLPRTKITPLRIRLRNRVNIAQMPAGQAHCPSRHSRCKLLLRADLIVGAPGLDFETWVCAYGESMLKHFSVFLLVLVGTSAFTQPKRPMTFEDMMAMKRLG